MNMYEKIKKCLCCGEANLHQFLDLGNQPLANNLIENNNQTTPEFPLEVNYCSKCWHSQLSISVDPEILFKDYFYVTGTSTTMHKYCENLADTIVSNYENSNNSSKIKILDIASNDGTFLEKFKKYGWDLYGVDPAANLKDTSEKKGIKTYVNFFGSDEIEFGTKFDVITALNVFAHVPNPLNFLIECKKHLKNNGKIIIQTSQRDMVEKRQFDTVYHEHISFFSVNSMRAVCKRAGLYLNDLYLPDIHGGSYVFYISMNKGISPSVTKRSQTEALAGRNDSEIYDKFQDDISSLSEKIKEKMVNNKMIAFGAAAKGIVALHALDLNPEFIVDENALKVGKILPKKNIPIVDIASLSTFDEELDIIILPWNFKDEISQKIINIRGKKDNLLCIF